MEALLGRVGVEDGHLGEIRREVPKYRLYFSYFCKLFSSSLSNTKRFTSNLLITYISTYISTPSLPIQNAFVQDLYSSYRYCSSFHWIFVNNGANHKPKHVHSSARKNSTGSTTTETNSCDASSLTYECICGNGLSPNASEYSLTLPYFICVQYGQDCVAACNGDNTCSSACRDDHPCGAQNPTRINTTSSVTQSATGTSGASSTNAVAYTGLGGSSSTSTPKSGAQLTMDFGKSYGLAVVFAGVFAGFALVL
ncbi:hypothetical protein EYC80_003594 [Monilinia laxa]|uniref:DUF7707 domain-containing protein n=1 Tax=Monilinia laxa TaxID=61186 RepID=A0A5N6KKG3_MONLA|nr:hypothetical protein EYC80_003594 [Monilinia laxa]